VMPTAKTRHSIANRAATGSCFLSSEPARWVGSCMVFVGRRGRANRQGN
jgi:hypothetical protein